MTTPKNQYEFPEGIVLINLDRRPDRLETFKKSLEASDIKDLRLHRISATDWKTIAWDQYITETAKQDIMKKVRRKGVGLTEGAIGCYLSHLNALKFIASQEKPWIVCEDDAFVPPAIKTQIQDVLEKTPFSNTTLLLFHSVCDKKLWDQLQCTPIGNNIMKITQFWSTLSYYVTPQTARVLVDLLEPPIDIQIDAKLSELATQNSITIYGRNIMQGSNSGSDIQLY